jgi:hypothetical protein
MTEVVLAPDVLQIANDTLVDSIIWVLPQCTCGKGLRSSCAKVSVTLLHPVTDTSLQVRKMRFRRLLKAAPAAASAHNLKRQHRKHCRAVH